MRESLEPWAQLPLLRPGERGPEAGRSSGAFHLNVINSQILQEQRRRFDKGQSPSSPGVLCSKGGTERSFLHEKNLGSLK